MNVFTIPPHRSFADALAGGLLLRAGGDRLALARTTLLVPSARAGRAVTDAFVRRAEGGLLLPRIVPIGALDGDDGIAAAIDPADADPVPPAIDPVERRMILARLVQEERVRSGDPIGIAEAMRLAADLARTIDQILAEEVPPARLGALTVEPELQVHWQRALDQLRVILDRWPEALALRGRIDQIDRRNRLLDRLARRWRSAPPPGPIVAAGIAIASPAIARLLGVIGRAGWGTVVLPFLDRGMPQDEWDALGPYAPDAVSGKRRPAIETHPQFALKRLLDGMGIGRDEVRTWRGAGGARAPATRTRVIADALAPAAFTHRWQDMPRHRRGLPGLNAIELASPAEEAQAIALLLRRSVETAGRTAALVTPDRALAERVSTHLRRWGIEADDTAGTPLSRKPAGTLLLLIAQAAAERFAPVPLLALLKHPLVKAGDERLGWLAGARALDQALRGPRPAAGLAGLTAHLDRLCAAPEAGQGPQVRVARTIAHAARGWWAEVVPSLEPLETCFSAHELPPAALFAALREAAMRLAGDAVWAGPAGRAAADLIGDLEATSALGPPLMKPADLPALLAAMLDEVAIRPPQGGHPRIFIRGLIEARLQQTDLTILGGLSEGVWPAAPAPDPWLAPRIRAELGLPGLEARIGQQAHDLALALGGPSVVLTRARRDARAPAIASRFWLRLQAMSGGLAAPPRLAAWLRAPDRPDGYAPADQPAPRPPRSVRPTRLSVTALDRLKADPFAFYANAILRLPALDAIDAEPTAAWRGSAVHDVLEAWMTEDDCAPEKLRVRAEALLDRADAHPVLRALWAPRLMEAIDWIAEETEAGMKTGRRPVIGEAKGERDCDGIVLHGRVDRIDRTADGSLAIIDYKTGQPPATRAVAAGFAMQLGLLGLIAERDPGFAGVHGTPTAFEYWSLAAKNGKLGYVATPVGGRSPIAAEDFTAQAARVLIEAVDRWLKGDAPFTAKLHPEYAPYGDYDQLMRLDEWYGRGSDRPSEAAT